MHWKKGLRSTGLTNYNRHLFSVLKIVTFLTVFFNFSGIRTGDANDVAAAVTLITALTYLFITQQLSRLKNPVFYGMAIYLLVSYLLLPFSVVPELSFKDLNKDVLGGFSLFLGIYLIVSQTKNNHPPDFIPGLNNLAIILLVLTGLGFLAILTTVGSLVSVDELKVLQFDGKLFHFTAHHNIFARKVELIFPFMVTGVLVASGIKQKIVFFFLSFFSAGVMFLNISRGGWACISVILILWGLLYLVKYRKYISSVGITLIFGLIIIVVWIFYPPFKVRTLSTQEEASTLTNRTKIWSEYITAIKKSPLVGWGYGSKITPARVKGESTAKKCFANFGPHNLGLGILFYQGIIGLIFFSLLVGITFVYILKGFFHSPTEELKLLYYACFCSFTAVILLHGLIEFISFKYLSFLSGLAGGLKVFLRNNSNWRN